MSPVRFFESHVASSVGEFCEQVVPQVVFDFAADAVEDLAHRVAQKSCEHCDGDDIASEFGSRFNRRSGPDAVDCDPEEPRDHTCDGRGNDYQRQSGGEICPVWGIVG